MLFKRNQQTILSKEDTEIILDCIRENESATSGEIRLCIEGHCNWMDPIIRAKEIFHGLKMFHTTDRNAVLIYIAYKDKDFAIYGDGAIHQKVDPNFWKKATKQLGDHFYHHQFKEGILKCVNDVGQQLRTFFPWEGEKKNELPDEIIFGK